MHAVEALMYIPSLGPIKKKVWTCRGIQITQQIFNQNRKYFNPVASGPGMYEWWEKNWRSKILWDCPFKKGDRCGGIFHSCVLCNWLLRTWGGLQPHWLVTWSHQGCYPANHSSHTSIIYTKRFKGTVPQAYITRVFSFSFNPSASLIFILKFLWIVIVADRYSHVQNSPRCHGHRWFELRCATDNAESNS